MSARGVRQSLSSSHVIIIQFIQQTLARQKQSRPGLFCSIFQTNYTCTNNFLPTWWEFLYSAPQSVLCAGFEEGLLSLLQITQITTTCPLPLSLELNFVVIDDCSLSAFLHREQSSKNKECHPGPCLSIPPHIHKTWSQIVGNPRGNCILWDTVLWEQAMMMDLWWSLWVTEQIW